MTKTRLTVFDTRIPLVRNDLALIESPFPFCGSTPIPAHEAWNSPPLLCHLLGSRSPPTDNRSMEAKMERFFESVGNFFTGGDNIPWCDRDLIAVSALGTFPSVAV